MLDKTQSLTPEVLHITQDKGTEPAFSGAYNDNSKLGTYLCRVCGLALFRSHSKFTSSCGWPSFDDEVIGSIERIPDLDGRRTEILCQRCHSHLGHVFLGEGFTHKNQRHCVNSLSVDFADDQQITDSREIIVAGGCFWGLEHYLKQEPGVVLTEVGYCGGTTPHPSYKSVCSGKTGHLEAVRIVFDSNKTTEKKLYKAFFEWHDPTQSNGQGPDIGSQYLSAIFYYDDQQLKVAEDLIQQLKAKSYDVVTKLIPSSTFWPAENMHQDYLEHNPTGYCSHKRTRLF